MATKQIGKLKLHWSSKGIAWKWGDGEIRRFSFQRKRSGDAAQGYDQAYGQGQGYGSPEDQGQSYGPEYGQGYGGQDGYDDDQEPREVGRYDVLYQSDWVMYALLVLLPPLGIWILWKKERFSPLVRAAVSAASGIWFILLLIWLFSAMFAPGGSDQVTTGVNTQIAIATPAPTIGGLATPAPQQGLDLVNAPPAATPRPGGLGTAPTGDAPDSPGTAGTTYVWSAPTSSVYHKADTCTAIREGESVTKVDIALARERGQTGCPTCFPDSAQSTAMFYIGSGKYYHKGSSCGTLSGLTPVSKQDAERQGKKPCPKCIGNVWATKPGKYYHKKPKCSGMTNAVLITEARAKADGKTKCPICYPGAAKGATKGTRYYATPKGKNYHTDKTCGGMKHAVEISLETAKKRKQTPCPICVTGKQVKAGIYYATKTGKYYHVKSSCSGMKNAARISLTVARKNGKTACPVCIRPGAGKDPAAGSAIYYATQAGKFYHKKATCGGMKGAKKVTRASAEKNGKKPCPDCLESLSIQVYATSGGKYYHRRANCSGMKNARHLSLATAKARGKTACPVCYPSAAAKNLYYFATKTGKYYHKNATCSGMKNASKLSLANALASGKQPCPVCLKANDRLYYATKSGKHFHLKSSCSGTGMTGGKPLTLAAARRAGKTPCPVCLKNVPVQDIRKVFAYVSSGSRYYHKDRTCSGLKNLKKVPLASAKARGKTACPVCVLKKVKAGNLTTAHADKRTVCYASASSAYYHQDSNCVSGLKKTTVAAARRNGKKACPSCAQNLNTYVYVTRSGTKYHRKSTCSGTVNAYKVSLNTALRLNYVRCTKCNAPRKK
ncbi:MAG: hypothetical protein VB065_04395 [Eubacteriales bacterium]|nr:hypothetical protein [Christensenellaceae bacterium]MEA5065270.1 hypothetical protein [Eubacteriales bacterium]